MPLVRYRLSDRTRWKRGPVRLRACVPDDRTASRGKFEDAITGGNGAPVSASVLTFAFKGLENIRKSQVAQVGPASWELRVVPMPGFRPADQQHLVDNIHHLVDPVVAVKIVLKDDLPNTAAGKFRWVVNEYRATDPPACIRHTAAHRPPPDLRLTAFAHRAAPEPEPTGPNGSRRCCRKSTRCTPTWRRPNICPAW